MKFGVLKSIGHNLADSLGSGICLIVGAYSLDIYGEVRHSPEGYIEVDFLTGTSMGATPSALLAEAFRDIAQALPGQCQAQGAEVSDFKTLRARFRLTKGQPGFLLTVEDKTGRRVEEEFHGIPARRTKVLDEAGRVRPKVMRSDE
ncbi:MAG: hypothetical protein AAF213_10450 [Pseudomonadota bacterium]